MVLKGIGSDVVPIPGKCVSSSLDGPFQGRCKHQGNVTMALEAIAQMLALLPAMVR